MRGLQSLSTVSDPSFCPKYEHWERGSKSDVTLDF